MQQQPDRPTLTSPADGAALSDNTPLLAWNAVSGAVEYRVQLDDDSDFSSPANFTSTTNSVTTSPLPSRTWYWRVQARDAAGNWSARSHSFSFTVQ